MEKVEIKPRDSVRLSSKNIYFIYHITKASKPHFTETIYQKQKRKIAELINEHKSREILKKSLETTVELNKVILFNDINLEESTTWEYSTFDVQNLFSEETPIIRTDWSESTFKPSIKGIEIRSLIFRTKDYLQLDCLNTEVVTTFSLKGESTFWLILRSDLEFNEYSAIIKIFKEDKSQNLHAAMGTFVRDIHNNLIFKVFTKQQLIDYSKVRNKSFRENDICELKLIVYENGDQKMTARIYVNDSKTENFVTSDFFLPFFDRNSRIMIAGSGQQCCVKSFITKCNIKLINGELPQNMFSTERKNCDCCLIY